MLSRAVQADIARDEDDDCCGRTKEHIERIVISAHDSGDRNPDSHSEEYDSGNRHKPEQHQCDGKRGGYVRAGKRDGVDTSVLKHPAVHDTAGVGTG